MTLGFQSRLVCIAMRIVVNRRDEDIQPLLNSEVRSCCTILVEVDFVRAERLVAQEHNLALADLWFLRLFRSGKRLRLFHLFRLEKLFEERTLLFGLFFFGHEHFSVFRFGKFQFKDAPVFAFLKQLIRPFLEDAICNHTFTAEVG